jgi:hypothetical protein
MSAVAKRASLPLSADDVALLRRAEDPTTSEGRKLAELTGEREITSEASLLKAVFELGLDRLRADLMFDGYRQLAVSYEADDESDYVDALKRRRRRHHQDSE